MTSLINMLEAGKASAVCSASKLLSVAVTCLSFGWQRAKSSVVKRGDVSRGNATVLVRACASLCACVNAARSCSNMALLVPLVTSLSRVRSLLECAWTLVASAMQLRSHVSGSNAAEAWAVACTQTTSFLLLLHAPVRAELIAPLLFEGEPLFSSLPCGATRGEMLHSATVHQRSALTVTHCLDYRGPMAGLQQIVSRGAGISLQGRFRVICTVFGLHAWALQPPPNELCESHVEGGTWSLTTSPALLCCSQHLSLLHRCALAAVSSACRVNISLIANSIGPEVLRSLGSPPDSKVSRDGGDMDLSVVHVAALCAIISSDGGCDWMFANEERLLAAFDVMCRTLQFVLSSSMGGSSLTKMVTKAFAILVIVTLDIVTPSSTSKSREFLRSSLQLPSIEHSSVQYMKHVALVDKIDRHFGRMLCICIRAMRNCPSAFAETEICVTTNTLMAATLIGGTCLSTMNSAWPMLARMVWRVSLDTIQFVESLCEVSCALEDNQPANVMTVGVSSMGIVLACIVLELRDSNFTATPDSADASGTLNTNTPVMTVREMFPFDLNPMSISAVHVAPYVRLMIGQGKSRMPTLVLLSALANSAVKETLRLPQVQQELAEAAGSDLCINDLFGDDAIVFSKLPGLLQFVLSRVVRKVGMGHADAAAEVCKRALGTAIVMSCDEWSKCDIMATQVVEGLAMHAIVQAIVSDADAGCGAFAMHQMPPLQIPRAVCEEVERQIVEKTRPNMKVRLQARVVAATGAATGAAFALQSQSATKEKQNLGRERMHKMLLKLYPQISAQQQLFKVIALSHVRDAWIERALLPLWVSVRVMKNQALGKTSRRRNLTISDRGLLPALLQV
jgi:hypothetical protein